MNRFLLAPMCGITDSIYRTLCFEQGCEQACTEMVSAMGYLCAPEQRATQELLVRGNKEPRLVIQLFGREPDIVAKAAGKICELDRFDGIDLNMGCPAKKIAPSGEGCGLMRTPEVARRMMISTVKVSGVPVSVKMRLGYDREHINVLEFAKMAEDAGISAITVHGRTREQQYGGEADWEMIARVKQTVGIPVIGNGDLFNAETALEKMNAAGTDGVMIGRGAMGNPWIFREIKAVSRGEKPIPVSLEERRGMIVRHYRMMLENKPEHIAVREMRKHIGWYIKGLRGAGAFRTKINSCQQADRAFELIEAFFSEQENGTSAGREESKGW